MNGMGAEGPIPWGFFSGDAHFGFKPLPIRIHQAEQGNWCIANQRRHGCDVVIALLRLGTEDSVFTQSLEPGIFIVRKTCGFQGLLFLANMTVLKPGLFDATIISPFLIKAIH